MVCKRKPAQYAPAPCAWIGEYMGLFDTKISQWLNLFAAVSNMHWILTLLNSLCHKYDSQCSFLFRIDVYFYLFAFAPIHSFIRSCMHTQWTESNVRREKFLHQMWYSKKPIFSMLYKCTHAFLFGSCFFMDFPFQLCYKFIFLESLPQQNVYWSIPFFSV